MHVWHTWRDLGGQYSCVVINGPRVDEHALGQLGNLSVKAWHQVVQCLQGQNSLESFSTKHITSEWQFAQSVITV